MGSNIQISASSISSLGKSHHHFVSCQTFSLRLNFLLISSILIVDWVLLIIFPTLFLTFPSLSILTGNDLWNGLFQFSCFQSHQLLYTLHDTANSKSCDVSSLIKFFSMTLLCLKIKFEDHSIAHQTLHDLCLLSILIQHCPTLYTLAIPNSMLFSFILFQAGGGAVLSLSST